MKKTREVWSNLRKLAGWRRVCGANPNYKELLGKREDKSNLKARCKNTEKLSPG